jgi:hypothetical protein
MDAPWSESERISRVVLGDPGELRNHTRDRLKDMHCDALLTLPEKTGSRYVRRPDR